MLNASIVAGLFISYEVGPSSEVYISHLLFVDDTPIFEEESWIIIRDLKDNPIYSLIEINF
jgi:hypothetical protein